MKLLTILSLLLWTSQIQIEPGKYVHKRNGSEYSLTINADSTFKYERPAVFNGNIKETGKWEIDENKLILKDSVKTSLSKSKVYSQKDEKSNQIRIKFVDENDKPLADWDVSLNDDDFKKKTDNQGEVFFDYSETKKRRSNQPKNTVEVVSLKSKTLEISVAIENIFDNQITIVEDFNPQIIYKHRHRNIEIKDDVLLFKNPTGINEQQEFEFRLLRN